MNAADRQFVTILGKTLEEVLVVLDLVARLELARDGVAPLREVERLKGELRAAMEGRE